MELETRKAAEPSLPRWQAVITALSVIALGTMDCEKVPCTRNIWMWIVNQPNTSTRGASLGLRPAETHSSLSLSFRYLCPIRSLAGNEQDSHISSDHAPPDPGCKTQTWFVAELLFSIECQLDP